MIEGGAVDWAGHANQLDRMIEEQIDFDNAVTEAVAWVEANSNWNETLIIVTADHETGYLMGASDGSAGFMDVNGNNQFDAGVDYAHLKNNGAGNLPGASWYSGNHTNQLVPLFAKGAGAELFNNYIVGTDANLDNYYGLAANGWTGFDGKYIDNTSIYSVMMEASGIPEPATFGILSISAGALVLRRRSR
ncbi:MAG: PEP-CTERM sorting domain-containing protein [Phycisphaerales bacterium]|nr:PEP-CTERM sorting domain-containing protein [Phycisphaerales bacterium]